MPSSDPIVGCIEWVNQCFNGSPVWIWIFSEGSDHRQSVNALSHREASHGTPILALPEIRRPHVVGKDKARLPCSLQHCKEYHRQMVNTSYCISLVRVPLMNSDTRWPRSNIFSHSTMSLWLRNNPPFTNTVAQ